MLLLSPAAITGTILFLVEGELEDPTDLVANLLLHNTRTIIDTRISASAFLIVHGVVKLGLVAGLASSKLWSYPAAIVVFTGFAIYQIYQLTRQSSLFLGVVTVLDIVVVLLVIAEYRHVMLARRRDFVERSGERGEEQAIPLVVRVACSSPLPSARLAGGYLSLGSVVGFVTLFGITMRNSMMMISHFEHLTTNEGMAWECEGDRPLAVPLDAWAS